MTNKLTTLQSLRDKVAQATQPDREIDADITETFGYVPPECEDGPELCGVPATWAGGGNIWRYYISRTHFPKGRG